VKKMSENGEKTDRTINVNVSMDDKDAELGRKVRKTAQDALYAKYQDEAIYEIDDLDKLIAEYGEPPSNEPAQKSGSTGVVSLKPTGNKSDLLRQEFETKGDMIKALAIKASQGDTQAKQTLDKLWSKDADVHGLENLKMNLDPAPYPLKPNFSWREFTEYMQAKSKERNEK
jgi:hypothetical protein